MKSYPIVCPSCKGEGFINTYRQVSSSAKEKCPACCGSKTVMCIETENNYSINAPFEKISNFR